MIVCGEQAVIELMVPADASLAPPVKDASVLVHTVSLVSAAKNCVFARMVQVVTRSVVIVIVHLAGEVANAIDLA